MELFDPVLLARIQFVLCVFVHFIFVPLSIGFGLFLAISESRYYKTKDPKDKANTRFWAKIFTTTFAIGVATGITMEFSFGTNWANYSRFVGDIFGAPLAAEALLAFFLESVFLGIVLFGRDKISPKLYLISTWLVWFGSALSALWILIANSWMQTPAGYEVAADGSKAVITDFWAAALNPSTLARYLHTVDSVIILASFCVIAIGAYHLVSKKNIEAGKKFMKVGAVVGTVTVVLMLPFAHMQAVVVAEEQPSKFAAMEGQWEDGPTDLAFFGWVDEDNKTTYSVGIPGGSSFLASWDFTAVYPGLNTTEKAVADFSEYPGVKVDTYQGGNPPVNFVFQAYHLMVAFYVLLIIWLVVAWLMVRKSDKGIAPSKGALRLLMFGPIIPFLCINAGWIVAEVGRQPWVVFDLLLTADGVSPAVGAIELLITIALFFVFYLILVVAWLRIMLKFIKGGPQALEEAPVAADTIDATSGSKTEGGEQ
ncbi:MAG TPA: cytochrome ubiquinol oxidase subunit I [Coriobacteriia bacterium]|nr:cytochrome ubiquinol oxidase subunit I [Coriobacteriia bacterium]